MCLSAAKRCTPDPPSAKSGYYVIPFSFLHFVALHASRPYLSLLAASLGADAVGVGIISSMYSIVQVVCALMIGRLIDRAGQKPPSVLGAACYVLGLAVLLTARSLWLVGFSALLMGFSHGVILMCGQHVMTGIDPKQGREHLVGCFAFSNSAGAFVGPYLGGAAVDALGVRLGFLAAGAVAVLALGASLLLPNIRCANGGDRAPVISLLRNAQVMKNVVLSGAVYFAADIITTYLSLFGVERGLSVKEVGLVLALNGMAQMVIRPFLGALCRRLSFSRVFYSCLVLGGASMITLGFAKNFLIMASLSVLVGLAIGLANPLTLLTVADGAGAADRSSVLALRVMGNYGAQTLSPLVFGALANLAGLSTVFFGSGGVLLFCVWASRRLGRHRAETR